MIFFFLSSTAEVPYLCIVFNETHVSYGWDYSTDHHGTTRHISVVVSIRIRFNNYEFELDTLRIRKQCILRHMVAPYESIFKTLNFSSDPIMASKNTTKTSRRSTGNRHHWIGHCLFVYEQLDFLR